LSRAAAICRPAVLAVLVAALAATPAFGQLERSGPAAVVATDELEDGVIGRINAARRDRGLTPLRPSAPLGLAAEAHARAMARLGFFAHVSRDGSSVRDRIQQFDSGAAGRPVGEVLLWRAPAPTPEEALAMWLASPSHRAVLLDPQLRLIGIGAITASAAPGVFGGLDATIVTADLTG
jgi:uncharacterized protein YkwD